MDNGSAPDKRQQLIKCLDELYRPEGYVMLYEGASGPLPRVGLLLLDDNRGYARGNNAGIGLCYGDDDITHIMVLNNDILFVEDIVTPLLSRAATIDDCGIISPLLFKRDMQGIDYNCARMNVTVGELISKNFFHYLHRLNGKDERQANPRRYPLLNRDKVDDMLLEVELPSGSCMLIDKGLMKKIGGFDPGTFLYYEENILYKKLKRLGKHNYIDTSLHCIHLGAATTSQMPTRSKTIVYHAIDSERYYVKNYSDASALMKALHAISSVFFKASFTLQKALLR